jgi:hypothetical protein
MLVGWDEIFERCSKNGWEIFSVVGVDKISAVTMQTGGASVGGTDAYRFFCRKPAE